MYAVRRWADIHAMSEHVMPFLLQHEEFNCVIIGFINIMIGSGRNIDPEQFYASVEHGGETCAVVLFTPPNGPACSKVNDAAAVRPLVAALYECAQALPYFIAEPEIGQIFLAEWQRLSGQPWRKAYSEALYRLDAVQYRAADVPGRMIAAEESYMPLLVKWADGFQREALGAIAPSNPEQIIRNRMGTERHLRGLRIWLNAEDEPVSMAGYSGPTPNGIRIGPVYTPPEARGFGYASALTATLTQELLDSGRRFVLLFADVDYVPSNRVYQRIGYHKIADLAQYVLGQKPEA